MQTTAFIQPEEEGEGGGEGEEREKHKASKAKPKTTNGRLQTVGDITAEECLGR